uniref:TopBP1-like BRCT0 domain-containing protein n=1 Tax=Plectus sambesii TaxID=2011161 RepID=A0A914VAU7_9BILA
RMESAGIAPQWITPAECLSLQSRGRNVFVIPAFRGPIFQHLSDLKCKLYGPPIVLQYLHKNTHLPRWSHPGFS